MLWAEKRALTKVNSVIWDQWCFDAVRDFSSMNLTWKFPGPVRGARQERSGRPGFLGLYHWLWETLGAFNPCFQLFMWLRRRYWGRYSGVQINPAGGWVSCQRLTEDGVEKDFGSLTAKVRKCFAVAWGFLPLYEPHWTPLFYLKSHHVLGITQCAWSTCPFEESPHKAGS